MKVLVINGPNLDMLGKREIHFYGSNTYDDLKLKILKYASDLGLEADIRQTNDEATMISWLHQAAESNLPVIINPAAFTHYSYAIRDAIVMVQAAKIEGLNIDIFDRHKEILKKLDLPIHYKSGVWEKLYSFMLNDKKRKGAQVRFVSLKNIGQCGRISIPESILREVYSDKIGLDS